MAIIAATNQGFFCHHFLLCACCLYPKIGVLNNYDYLGLYFVNESFHLSLCLKQSYQAAPRGGVKALAARVCLCVRVVYNRQRGLLYSYRYYNDYNDFQFTFCLDGWIAL